MTNRTEQVARVVAEALGDEIEERGAGGPWVNLCGDYLHLSIYTSDMNTAERLLHHLWEKHGRVHGRKPTPFGLHQQIDTFMLYAWDRKKRPAAIEVLAVACGLIEPVD